MGAKQSQKSRQLTNSTSTSGTGSPTTSDSLQSMAFFDVHRSISRQDYDVVDSKEALKDNALDYVRKTFITKVAYKLHSRIESKESLTEISKSFDECVFLPKKWSLNQSQISGIAFSYDIEIIRPRNSIPNVKFVESFISQILGALKIPLECLVIMMIYLERLQKTQGFHLSGANWRPIAFTALLLSSKIWDDNHPFNIEFSLAYRVYTPKTILRMEMAFWKMINWRLYFEPELYAQYFFSLTNTSVDKTGTYDRWINSFAAQGIEVDLSGSPYRKTNRLVMQ